MDRFDAERLWRFRAAPIRVIDGDTIVVLIDTGFHGRHEATIRLADFDAPELNTPEGKKAKDKMFSVVGWMSSSGWPLRIVTRQAKTKVSEVMSFTRYVADVYIFDVDNVMVNIKDLL